MLKILTLNKIAAEGLARFPADRYAISSTDQDPDAILVRSAKMHDLDLGPTLKAVGRAGTGVNNIPVGKLSARGIPVFNTPGANANAVKELVIVGLILGCRHICRAWEFTRHLDGTDEAINRAVEAGKNQFVGIELPGRTLGVVGLGAIGRLVANTAIALGMNVIGFDPGLTVDGAWQLSSQVRRASSLEDLLRASQFVTVHVPLIDATRHLVNGARLALMRTDAVVLNFARDAIVDEAAVVDALDGGRLAAYVCDFPSNRTKNHPKVIALPHLGASTVEAEDHCAIAVAGQIRDFLEHGNVSSSVNFPDVVVSRGTPHRLICANANVPNMLGQISEALGHAGLNIHDMVNQSRGEIAYTVVDLDQAVPERVAGHIAAIPGVLMARLIEPPRGT